MLLILLRFAAFDLLDPLTALIQIKKLLSVTLEFSFLLDRQFESGFDELRARVLYRRRRVRRRLHLAAARAVGVAGRILEMDPHRRLRFRRRRTFPAELVVVQGIRHGYQRIEYLRRPGRVAARIIHIQEAVDGVARRRRQVHV